MLSASRKRNRINTIAVIADPVFSMDDPRLQENRSAAPQQNEVDRQLTRAAQDFVIADSGFPRLIGTRREAAEILALVPPSQRKEALDFDANREDVMAGKFGGSRIVHFATHGLLNSKHPELSGLVLSLVNKKGGLQDGFLRLQDIYNLNLPADLIVLSACQTALGQDVRGEGLIGLTRGFLYAGAARVMASLWKVDDKSTAEYMKLFYQTLLREKTHPAAAMRKSQLSLMAQKRWQSPYYWAAFVLQGE
jgi:CHAT domain-containing protein